MIGDLGACLSSNYSLYFLKFIFYIMISKYLKTQKKNHFSLKHPKSPSRAGTILNSEPLTFPACLVKHAISLYLYLNWWVRASLVCLSRQYAHFHVYPFVQKHLFKIEGPFKQA
jgi:hypothetical protein